MLNDYNNIVLTEDLWKELNARNKYMVRYFGNVEYFDGYWLNINYDIVDIKDDVAKVILCRDIQFRDKDLNENVTTGEVEGYVLKKDNGQWKIVNVIFCMEFWINILMHWRAIMMTRIG